MSKVHKRENHLLSMTEIILCLLPIVPILGVLEWTQPGLARKPGREERYGRAHKCGRLWQFKKGLAPGVDLEVSLIAIERALFPTVEFSRY